MGSWGDDGWKKARRSKNIQDIRKTPITVEDYAKAQANEITPAYRAHVEALHGKNSSQYREVETRDRIGKLERRIRDRERATAQRRKAATTGI